jgi:integrase/recombinase XerD
VSLKRGPHDHTKTADGGGTPATQLLIAVKQFAEYFGKAPDRLGATHVQRFQWYLLQERKLTPGTVEMRTSALRFFFKKMLKRRDPF